MQLSLIAVDQQWTPGEDCGHVHGKKYKEEEKMSIVSAANAIIDPWTVMIKGL